MEFNEKLQELRKQKGLTQEELAEKLYVSRTAISKWESGRGYPNIESLKAISRFFSVTVDELISSDEMLTVAEEDKRQTETHFRDLVFGLVDICASLLLVLPLFAIRADGLVKEISLISPGGISAYLLVAYYIAIISTTAIGILTLALQSCKARPWVKSKTMISLILGIVSSLLLIVSSQPYAAVFMFSLLIIKAIVLIKHK